MSSTIAEARDMANELVMREYRGPGDLDNAMRRVEGKYGIPHSFLWALRYRPPKDILVGALQRLSSAYRLECARQERLAAATRARAEALDNAASKIIARAGDVVAGAKD